MPRSLASASRNYAISALIAKRAVRQARTVRPKGSAAVGAVVITHQIAQARSSQIAVREMLAEQNIDAAAEALLNTAQFTTSVADFEAMVDKIAEDWQFNQLIASIVQDAGRAAESVSVAVRRNLGWVRHLTLPSCYRCVPLAGRVYRYSEGFLRHPGCDCAMTPVREGDETFVADPAELVAAGQVTGLSKADAQAVLDGADFNQVVNVHRKAAGLLEAGHALTRGGRPTPAGIYRAADGDHARALELLRRYSYIR